VSTPPNSHMSHVAGDQSRFIIRGPLTYKKTPAVPVTCLLPHHGTLFKFPWPAPLAGNRPLNNSTRFAAFLKRWQTQRSHAAALACLAVLRLKSCRIGADKKMRCDVLSPCVVTFADLIEFPVPTQFIPEKVAARRWRRRLFLCGAARNVTKSA
jgi:hypothetical protein